MTTQKFTAIELADAMVQANIDDDEIGEVLGNLGVEDIEREVTVSVTLTLTMNGVLNKVEAMDYVERWIGDVTGEYVADVYVEA
jgi:hypothetical protein